MPISSISSTRSPNRRWLALLLAAVGLLLLLASILLGAAPLPLPEVVRTLLGQAPDTSTYNIVFFARLPRSLACVLAGTALAVAGLLLQAGTEQFAGQSWYYRCKCRCWPGRGAVCLFLPRPPVCAHAGCFCRRIRHLPARLCGGAQNRSFAGLRWCWPVWRYPVFLLRRLIPWLRCILNC